MPERRALVAIWLVSAVLLSGLLAVGRLTRTSGDDPDPGRQRPGILDLGALPQPAPEVPGVDLPAGQAAVVFLAPGATAGQLCARLDDHELDAEVVIVTDTAPGDCGDLAVAVAAADVARIGRAFGLPDPLRDPAPTGYVLVDADGQIRYRTLDPLAAELLDEVATMLRGVR